MMIHADDEKITVHSNEQKDIYCKKQHVSVLYIWLPYWRHTLNGALREVPLMEMN